MVSPGRTGSALWTGSAEFVADAVASAVPGSGAATIDGGVGNDAGDDEGFPAGEPSTTDDGLFALGFASVCSSRMALLAPATNMTTNTTAASATGSFRLLRGGGGADEGRRDLGATPTRCRPGLMPLSGDFSGMGGFGVTALSPGISAARSAAAAAFVSTAWGFGA